ncbi:MAG: carbonic anhydrase family protein, partial [Urechidicola sp.]|nr:carbonic anhydrase family protein [Urechidicola sp.]
CKKEKKTENIIDTKTEKIVSEEVTKHWSYDGESNPEHWAEIEKESSCGGNHQSPIDIVTSDVVSQPSGLKVWDINYHASTIIHDVTNNGHSIQYNFDDKDNYVNFRGKRYDLAQFHFHAASEHIVDGMHFPLVAHLVHVSKDKEFVVFAVMFLEGEESENLTFLESYLPVKPGETKAIEKPHSFSGYIFEHFDHYYYKGSLTTPPCTETVNWFVFKNPISASPAQIEMMADLMPRNNFRPTQPLNDREVYLSK